VFCVCVFVCVGVFVFVCVCVCVCVDLVMQRAMRMRHIVIFVEPRSTNFFHVIS